MRILALTSGTLACFAANSLLCRGALGPRLVDPATFTALRLGAGALVLVALAGPRRAARQGDWSSALTLIAYAVAFSLAYERVQAGPGALLLFGAVQITMVGWGIATGGRPTPIQWLGMALALAGLAHLTLGSAHAPDAAGATLMVVAGVAWGIYSLRGRGVADPLGTIAGQFLRAAPLALLPLLALAISGAGSLHATATGAGLAIASGAIASAGGYVAWYAVVPSLGATRAAAVQLAVPVIAALAAVGLLGEPLTLRLASSAAVILSGVALAVVLPALGRPPARG